MITESRKVDYEAQAQLLEKYLAPEFVAPASGWDPEWAVDRHGHWSVRVQVALRDRRKRLVVLSSTSVLRDCFSPDEATAELIASKDIWVEVHKA
ncbi:MAG: hypothetical protein WC565_05250 [Parcubacteria group bacterium]|jgi:hypothetical protein